MMNGKRGSLGIFVLLAGFVLSIIVQQGAIYFRYLAGYQEDYLVKQQLSLLAGSTMGVLAAKEELPVGTRTLLEEEALAGKQKVIVQQKVTQSSDACFQHVVVTAGTQGGATKKVQQLRYSLNKEMQSLAKDYVLISPNLTLKNGAKADIIYKQISSGKVIWPTLSFLSGKSVTNISNLSNYGFGRVPYYLNDISLNLLGDISGSTLLASKKDIVLGKEGSTTVTLLDNVILIATDNVRIKSNVRLRNVLIVARKDVYLEGGCELQGAVFSKTRITVEGPATLVKATQPITSFSSVALSNLYN